MEPTAAATRFPTQTTYQERLNLQWWQKQAYTLKPSFLRFFFSRTTTQGTSSVPEIGHTIPEKRKATLLASRSITTWGWFLFIVTTRFWNGINLTPVFQMTVCPGVHSVWGEVLKEGFNKGSFWPPNPHPSLYHAKCKCHSSLGDENDWPCKCKLPYHSALPTCWHSRAGQAPTSSTGEWINCPKDIPLQNFTICSSP